MRGCVGPDRIDCLLLPEYSFADLIDNKCHRDHPADEKCWPRAVIYSRYLESQPRTCKHQRHKKKQGQAIVPKVCSHLKLHVKSVSQFKPFRTAGPKTLNSRPRKYARPPFQLKGVVKQIHERRLSKIHLRYLSTGRWRLFQVPLQTGGKASYLENNPE